MIQLQITTFGEFTLQCGENCISDRDNRSRKVWLLLAYLLCRRGRTVPTTELIGQIWGEDSGENPENALKVTLHRARGLLDQLWEKAGHELIERKGTGYCWNTNIPLQVDADQFEKLCKPDPLTAVSLYQGEFLGKLSSGSWVIPIATHYHNLYIDTLLKLLPQLLAQKRYGDVISLCRTAIPLEPYNEPLHCFFMRALAAQGDTKAVAKLYDELRARLFHDFGITPHEETRSLYRSLTNTIAERTMPIETVLEHLLETDPAAGALQCDFDIFRVLCHAEARTMIRSGNATHVALLSVSGERNKTLSQRSLERAIENLGEQIRLSLRRGDAFSQCSPSQFVVMLPQANYENSCVVCRRIISAFFRRYPHSPTQINFLVRPLSTHTLEQ